MLVISMTHGDVPRRWRWWCWRRRGGGNVGGRDGSEWQSREEARVWGRMREDRNDGR